ncbi:hypothetical protein [Planomicrobium okeanokoites]|uniref:Uncharacterized protein n=1 Tax=Planomicrobium okeanokoites TaxID=244 RepID=A0ABV7KTB6_PLAOK|nr:hypothetical protein [Planomicrobium okeanokoites]TAA70258.1 hypothetical protein D2910_07345 [Planomicrobium okeanokoites]
MVREKRVEHISVEVGHKPVEVGRISTKVGHKKVWRKFGQVDHVRNSIFHSFRIKIRGVESRKKGVGNKSSKVGSKSTEVGNKRGKVGNKPTRVGSKNFPAKIQQTNPKPKRQIVR